MTYKISPSSLGILKECPRCFWLHVIKNFRRPENFFSTLPNRIDLMLKKRFDFYREKKELPPELKQYNLDVKLFSDKETLKIWRNNLKGISCIDENSGVLLYGAVDEILQRENKLIVIDFKTRGFDLKEHTANLYKNRINLYNFLLRKNGFETEDYSYLFFYIPEQIKESGEFIFKTNLVKVDISIKDAEDTFQRAVNVLTNNIPKPNPNCRFCYWGKIVSLEV